MKKTELLIKFRGLDINKIVKIIEENKSKLNRLYFDVSFGKLKNNAQIKKIKKEIALLNTIINEKVIQKVK